MQQQDKGRKTPKDVEFFTEYGEANRYKILEIIGKGSYGVVCAAIDTQTGEKVAIKKITDIFEHISDAIRILREIKLLRLLRHPDIVEIKRIMMPPSRRDFRDIYVVFELMESDLHQVIKANDDLTHDHHRFFLYQMLRALKYMHTANVYHRDLKPKNILANANCKLKICDFGLARVAFSDTPTTIFWTYTPAIDIWSVGCIFAEVLTGKPLFPGKSVVHQLDLITDLLGTPSTDTISGVRNEKARKYLMDMRKKRAVPFAEKIPNADPSALKLLQRLLAFDPKDRPSAEEALADPYFKGLSKIEREPSCQPISKLEFEFERRRVTKEDIRELIFREILEDHPQLLKDYMARNSGTSFLYPSAIGHFKKQFAYLEETGKSGPVIPPERKHVSLPRSTINSSTIPPKAQLYVSAYDNRKATAEAPTVLGVPDSVSGSVPKVLRPPPRMPNAKPGRVVGPVLPYENVRHVNDSSYDGGVYVLPSQSISPQCYFRTSTGTNQNDSRMSASQVQQQPPPPNQQQYVAPQAKSINGTYIDMKGQPKLNPPVMGGDMNSNPYYQPHSKAVAGGINIMNMNGQIAIDAKLLQAQTQFVVAGPATATHREVAAVQIGLT
ncbi:Mitogen-activated protein kinase 19 [Striga hermonthica]|uniref:Mitogen-activated protein kinase 19 n=1 Tax=Striga hermonthica TaxID=68872 RepID=A0A9N7R8N3_STRHE|nr:Mitogen-activated protein kinase 19 [Striga hermonthica]